MSRSSRIALGVLALALLAGGVAWHLAEPGTRTAGILVRSGLMAGAAWLVAPMIRRPRLATLAWGAALLASLMRPRFIVAVVVAAVAWRLATRRPSSAKQPHG